jgi:archaellum biogenesis ATPase FlaH
MEYFYSKDVLLEHLIIFNKTKMIKNFLQNFKKLPDSNKAMIYLMWIYNSG